MAAKTRGAVRQGAIWLAMPALLFAAAEPAHAELVVSANPTENVSCTDGVCKSTAKVAVLNVDDLANMLASGDVTVKSAQRSADIVFDAALTWASTHRLTVDSYHSIEFTAPVIVAGTAALTIVTNDGGAGGDFSFGRNGHIQFWDVTSALKINGEDYLLYSDLQSLKDSLGDWGLQHYALANDIVTKGKYAKFLFRQLGGTFEGLGNTISKLRILAKASGDIGLFADVTGIVRDINLTKADITGGAGNADVAALVGLLNGGTILNAHVDGMVTAAAGTAHVGGLVGLNIKGMIARSSATATVTDSRNDTFAIGGLVGASNGTLDQDYSGGSVTTGDFAGAGGLAGINAGTISNCYSTASATGANNAFVGGFIGENLKDDPDITFVSNAYSTGVPSGGSGARVGGLMGEDQVRTGVTDTYWDMDTSGVNDPTKGAGDIANDAGITGLSDAQLKSGLPAGFDPTVWKQKSKLNGGYPYLVNNPPR